MKRFLCCLAFFTAAAGLFAQLGFDTQPVAIVRLSRSQPISVKEFKDYVKWMNLSRVNSQDPSARTPLSPDDRRKILDTISNQLLACQAAEKDNITVSEKDITQALDEELKPLYAMLTQKLGRSPSEAEVDNELRTQTGMNKAGFREQIRRSLITNKYLQFKKQSLFQSLKPPTEAEIQRIYNELKNKSFLDGGFLRPDAIRIKMIWVPAANPADRTKALEKANQLLRQIGGDAGRFDEVVDDSRKPNSGYMGGDGPYLYKNEQIRAAMGIDFYDTAFRLKQAEISKLLERPDGYYIIKVTETYRQKILSLDDVYRLEDPRRTTVRDFVLISEAQKRQLETYEKASLELVEELKKQGSVEIKNDIYNSITW
jgi:parvulin-like peptidyl-prolyl isomerase